MSVSDDRQKKDENFSERQDSGGRPDSDPARVEFETRWGWITIKGSFRGDPDSELAKSFGTAVRWFAAVISLGITLYAIGKLVVWSTVL